MLPSSIPISARLVALTLRWVVDAVWQASVLESPRLFEMSISFSGFTAAFHREGEKRATIQHLVQDQRMLQMALETRIAHLHPPGPALEPGGDGGGVVGLPFHPRRNGLKRLH